MFNFATAQIKQAGWRPQSCEVLPACLPTTRKFPLARPLRSTRWLHSGGTRPYVISVYDRNLQLPHLSDRPQIMPLLCSGPAMASRVVKDRLPGIRPALPLHLAKPVPVELGQRIENRRRTEGTEARLRYLRPLRCLRKWKSQGEGVEAEGATPDPRDPHPQASAVSVTGCTFPSFISF